VCERDEKRHVCVRHEGRSMRESLIKGVTYVCVR